MAQTSRYTYCPAAGKIRGNRMSLMEWLRHRRYRRNRLPDLFTVVNYCPAIYPTKK